MLKNKVYGIIGVSKCLQRSMCTAKKKDESTNPQMSHDLTKATDLTSKVELSKMITSKDLEWRTPWHAKEGQHYDFLRSFYKEESNAPTLKYMQQPLDFSPSAIKNWWRKRQQQKTLWMQHYIPERNEKLGNELAAAHFIVFRGGAVKFFGEDRWIKADKFDNYSLPVHFQADKILQAIDCSYMELYYEGFVNLRNLYKTEWLSFYGCEEIDDWCMDRISNIFSKTLLYLDIRECPKITDRGLGALWKIKSLKILYVDSFVDTNVFEMTCLMLQEVNPDLDIRTN